MVVGGGGCGGEVAIHRNKYAGKSTEAEGRGERATLDVERTIQQALGDQTDG